MIHFISKVFKNLQPYIPLFQSLVWPIFITILIVVLRKQVGATIKSIQQRIEKGSSVKAGPFEIGEDLKKLDYAQPKATTSIKTNKTTQDWDQERSKIYKDNHGLFLTHIITKSRDPEQKYDIYIYLIKHKSTDLSDIDFAEFFFGHMWGSQIFREFPKNGIVGISTSAYGPFLCTCRIHLRDNKVLFLSRYIDFEMEKLLT